MTKQKQIEEMALEFPEEIRDPLDNSRYIIFGKSLRRAIAQTYYNAGYRKIDENCAVITKDELKLYQKQAVKEFAEKLKEKALSHCRTINCYELKFIEETIDELLKEYE